MQAFKISIVIVAAVALTKSDVVYPRTPNHLQHVQELLIKPSPDGTSGDLYVAATEETGKTLQWLADQPLQFLPPFSQLAERLNAKRAIVGPQRPFIASQPQPGNAEINVNSAYPYNLQAIESTPSTGTKIETPCNAASSTPYNPYSYIYPQIMSSFANMANILKGAGVSEETASSLVPQAPILWPQAYAYPVQYMMVDPSAWANTQGIITAASNMQERGNKS